MWTQEQRRAIETNGNLLVSAAAGSGKTAVLTERIARLVAEGTDIDRMLVVTFTKAAAEEMKKRIERRLLTLAQEREESAAEQTRIREQAAAVPTSNVSTIHSFCARVLKRHFCEAGIAPDFSVASESSAAVMRTEALDEVMELFYSERMAHMRELQTSLGGRDEIRKSILSIYNFMQARTNPFGWLMDAFSAYATDSVDISAFEEAALEAYKARARLMLADYTAFCGRYSDYAGIYALLMSDAAKLRRLADAMCYDAYIDAIRGVSFDRYSAKLWGDLPHDERDEQDVKNYRAAVRDAINKERKSLVAYSADEHNKMAGVSAHACLLCDLVKHFCTAYAAKKRDEGVIDYSDMEHMTLDVLSHEEVACEYREQFDYIFVDEYQDSNRVQESILEYVKREDNLFMVGDVKQSIYRFRLAEPRLFLEKYASYDGSRGTRIDLNSNFRSSDAVISCVNSVFSRIMQGGATEIVYDDGAALKAGRSGCRGSAEVFCIPKDARQELGEDEDEGDAVRDLARCEREALLCAAQIKRIIRDERFTDPRTGEQRKYRYSDFCVLMRSKNNASPWVKLLASEGIPAYSGQRDGYFEAIEVQVFMNMLRVIDNRRQDIPLVSVLSSEIGAFTTEELIEMRARHRHGSCYDALEASSREATPLGDRAAGFLEQLEKWSKFLSLYSVEEAIGMLLDDTGYYRCVGLMPGGEQRLSNLDALCECAKQYESGRRRGLHGFIAFMDVLKQQGDAKAALAGESESLNVDVVRIMTVHKSKGLEFPVVILADAAQRFPYRRMSARSSVNCSEELGVGLRCSTRSSRRETIAYKTIRMQSNEREHAEELRVLYVAMTRAIERLIVIGTCDIGRTVSRLSGMSGAWTAVNASCYMDLIMGAALATSSANPVRKWLGIGVHEFAPSDYTVRVVEGSARELAGHAVSRSEFDELMRELSTRQCPDLFAEFRVGYPDIVATQTPSKLTVSMLADETPRVRELPAFMRDVGPVTPAERGTIMHSVLKRITLTAHTPESVAREVERMVGESALTEREAREVDCTAIARFMTSPIGKRLCASREVRREVTFNYSAGARRFLAMDTDESFILQGMIDCFFEEDGEWVLLDYKTDFVMPGADPRPTAMKHQKQLSLYSAALADMTQRKVKAQYVCLLSVGEAVEVPFDA